MNEQRQERERHDNLEAAYADLVVEAEDDVVRLRARVAELEAQLAAQGWRPESEPVPLTGPSRLILARWRYDEWMFEPARVWEDEREEWVSSDHIVTRHLGWYLADENDEGIEPYQWWMIIAPPLPTGADAIAPEGSAPVASGPIV